MEFVNLSAIQFVDVVDSMIKQHRFSQVIDDNTKIEISPISGIITDEY